MTYHEQLEQAGLKIMLDAVARAEGSQHKAAEALGIHRNSITRMFRRNGWNILRVRQYAEDRNPVIAAKREMKRRTRIDHELLKKPVQAVGLDLMLNGTRLTIEKWTA